MPLGGRTISPELFRLGDDHGAASILDPAAFPDTYPGLGAEITFIECIGDLSRVDVRVQRPGNGNPARDKIHWHSTEMHYHMVVDRLGTTFAALSDPTRRAMIERLSHGPASVHGLTEPFALSQQMISKHIAYLVRARIVIKTKRGRESVCTLRPEAIKTVSDWAFTYRRFWEESFDKLEVVVNQMKKEEVWDERKHG
jgi:DNA-binding transcriptional ArsR family regulator